MSYNLKDIHAMIDIETLGLSTDCPLLEVSLCVFSLEEQPIYAQMLEMAVTLPFNVHDQLHNLGRKPLASTLHWWMTTAAAANNTVLTRSLLSKNDNVEVLSSLRAMLRPVDHVWCRGPHFDAALLNSLTADYEVHDLWPFYKTRDIRTLLYALGKETEAKATKDKMEKDGVFIKHDSAHDVAIDAYLINEYLRERHFQDVEVANGKRKSKSAK